MLKKTALSLLTAALLSCSGAVWATPPSVGTASPVPNFVNAGNYVGSPSGVTASITDDNNVVSCQGTFDGVNWTAGTISGGVSSGTFSGSCTATGLACTDGQSLTLNIQATDSLNNPGTGTSVSRTCDTVPPASSDNAPSAWQANDVTVTLAATDSESGVSSTRYCTDSANMCSPGTTGTSVSVTCAAGNVCQTYVRYQSLDNVGNTESVKSVLVRIDKQAPSGGSISYPNGATSSPISVSFTDGSDGSGSGIGTRLLQRAQANLNHGNNCGTFGAFSTIATNPTSPFSDPVSAGACYKYRYDVADNVGNHAVYASQNVAKVK